MNALTASDTRKVYAYFIALTLLIGLATPNGYLVDIATSYMLKNQLHASAEDVARYRLLSAIPIFIGFVFGLIRDSWNPFGLRDRGYLIIFTPLTGVAFVWLAFGKLEFSSLLIGVMLAMAAFQLVGAAYQALMTLIGQEHLMSGRLAALYWTVLVVPNVLAAWSSGWVTEHLTVKQIFLLLASICFACGLVGFYKPDAVFKSTYDAPLAKRTTFFKDIARLARHRAVYPAVVISFMWNFAPGAQTPLQYYLTDKLHASDAAYSNYTAVFVISFLPTYLLTAFLCKRVPLMKILIWGTLLAIPQMIPLLFIHSGDQAVLMAIPIGLMGGVATVAYWDLAMRSCPPGLQGSLMMMCAGVYALSARGGDLLGTKIYDADKTHGFLYCTIATTAVYAVILPLLWWIPREIVSTRDGEAAAT